MYIFFASSQELRLRGKRNRGDLKLSLKCMMSSKRSSQCDGMQNQRGKTQVVTTSTCSNLDSRCTLRECGGFVAQLLLLLLVRHAGRCRRTTPRSLYPKPSKSANHIHFSMPSGISAIVCSKVMIMCFLLPSGDLSVTKALHEYMTGCCPFEKPTG